MYLEIRFIRKLTLNGFFNFNEIARLSPHSGTQHKRGVRADKDAHDGRDAERKLHHQGNIRGVVNENGTVEQDNR